MKINFFKSPVGFRKGLSQNHDKAQELWLGFHKTRTGKSGMTYSEALDEALCYGSIDAFGKGIDAESYHWVMSAKKKETQISRLNILIHDSESGQDIRTLKRP